MCVSHPARAELAQQRRRARHRPLRSGRSTAVRTRSRSGSKSVRRYALVEVPPRDEGRAAATPLRSPAIALAIAPLAHSSPRVARPPRRISSSDCITIALRRPAGRGPAPRAGTPMASLAALALARHERQRARARGPDQGLARAGQVERLAEHAVRVGQVAGARERLAELPAEDQHRAHRIVELAAEDLARAPDRGRGAARARSRALIAARGGAIRRPARGASAPRRRSARGRRGAPAPRAAAASGSPVLSDAGSRVQIAPHAGGDRGERHVAHQRVRGADGAVALLDQARHRRACPASSSKPRRSGQEAAQRRRDRPRRR